MNLTWITDINVKCKTIQLLEDNGRNVNELEYSDDFLHIRQKE
jgi:hypothetical protein